MKIRARDVLVLLLIGAVAVLAVAVDRKADRTAVQAQVIDRLPDISTAAAPDTPRPQNSLVFIGDFTDGSNEGGDGDRNWTALVGQEINNSKPVRVVVDSTGGGSGYVVLGSSPSFADQVRRLVTPDASVVVISGSRSDVVADPALVSAAALDTYALVHKLAPRANLIVIGPTWGTVEPTPELLAIRDALREAATVSIAYFVDPIADGWFTNGPPGLIGADSVHPTDAGNKRIAELMTPIVAAALVQARQ